MKLLCLQVLHLYTDMQDLLKNQELNFLFFCFVLFVLFLFLFVCFFVCFSELISRLSSLQGLA